MLAPLNAEKWSLSDPSAQGTFGVYSRKVDVTNPGETEFDSLEQEIWDLLARTLPVQGRKLTVEEAIGRMRSKASGGLPMKDWEDTPELRQQVL